MTQTETTNSPRMQLWMMPLGSNGLLSGLQLHNHAQYNNNNNSNNNNNNNNTNNNYNNTNDIQHDVIVTVLLLQSARCTAALAPQLPNAALRAAMKAITLPKALASVSMAATRQHQFAIANWKAFRDGTCTIMQELRASPALGDAAKCRT